LHATDVAAHPTGGVHSPPRAEREQDERQTEPEATNGLLLGGVFELVVEQLLGESCVAAGGGVGQVEDQRQVKWVRPRRKRLVQDPVNCGCGRW
jgi:hypothetical protein